MGGSTDLYFPHLFVLSVIAALSKGKNQMPESVIFKVKTHSLCLDKNTFFLSDSTLRTGMLSQMINPFTAPACKISRLKAALTRPQTVYFLAL